MKTLAQKGALYISAAFVVLSLSGMAAFCAGVGALEMIRIYFI